MNIGMVLDNEFTGDMRVENEVISLQKAGFNVFVLALNHGSKESVEEYHSAKIIRLPLSVFLKKKMKGLILTMFDFYKHYWSKHIRSFVRDYNIDVLHVHDLYMLGAAFHAKEKGKLNIPVIGDLHENYPFALENYAFTKKFPGKYIISIPKWKAIEKVWVDECDHVITVIEESRKRYEELGIPPKAISVVPNYVSKNTFQVDEIFPDIVNKYKENFVISYAGGFDYHRGIEVAIKSMPRLIKAIPNIKLVLIGEGINKNELIELSNSLGLTDYITFEGWQKPVYLSSFFAASDICIIPHVKSVHTDNTIPHKLFQYMLMEKAVITSNCDPFVRILDATKAGLYFTSGNHDELASQIEYLYNNPEVKNEMEKKGKQAVINTYNWEEASKQLIDLYRNINTN